MEYVTRNNDSGEVFKFDTISQAEIKEEELMKAGFSASALPTIKPTEEFKQYVKLLREKSKWHSESADTI